MIMRFETISREVARVASFNDPTIKAFDHIETTNSSTRQHTEPTNRIGQMVSFELGKEKEKDVFRLQCHERGRKKKSEPLYGIEPQTFGIRALMLYHRTTETLW